MEKHSKGKNRYKSFMMRGKTISAIGAMAALGLAIYSQSGQPTIGQLAQAMKAQPSAWTVVVGANAKASDVVGASNIVAALETFTSVPTNMTTNQSNLQVQIQGTIPVIQNSYPLYYPSEPLYLGYNLNSVVNVLSVGSGTFQTNYNGQQTTYQYNAYVYPSNQYSIQYIEPTPGQSQPVVSLAATGPTASPISLNLTFSPSLNLTQLTQSPQAINIFNTTYYMVPASNGQYINFVPAADVVTLNVNQSTTFNGVQITLQGVTAQYSAGSTTSTGVPSAVLNINGRTVTVQVGSQEYVDGINVLVVNVYGPLSNEVTTTQQGYVELVLGNSGYQLPITSTPANVQTSSGQVLNNVQVQMTYTTSGNGYLISDIAFLFPQLPEIGTSGYYGLTNGAVYQLPLFNYELTFPSVTLPAKNSDLIQVQSSLVTQGSNSYANQFTLSYPDALSGKTYTLSIYNNDPSSPSNGVLQAFQQGYVQSLKEYTNSLTTSTTSTYQSAALTPTVGTVISITNTSSVTSYYYIANVSSSNVILVGLQTGQVYNVNSGGATLSDGVSVKYSGGTLTFNSPNGQYFTSQTFTAGTNYNYPYYAGQLTPGSQTSAFVLYPGQYFAVYNPTTQTSEIFYLQDVTTGTNNVPQATIEDVITGQTYTVSQGNPIVVDNGISLDPIIINTQVPYVILQGSGTISMNRLVLTSMGTSPQSTPMISITGLGTPTVNIGVQDTYPGYTLVNGSTLGTSVSLTLGVTGGLANPTFDYTNPTSTSVTSGSTTTTYYLDKAGTYSVYTSSTGAQTLSLYVPMVPVSYAVSIAPVGSQSQQESVNVGIGQIIPGTSLTVEGVTGASSTTTTYSAPQALIGNVILTSQVNANNMNNMVLVGGPAVNTLTAQAVINWVSSENSTLGSELQSLASSQGGLIYGSQLAPVLQQLGITFEPGTALVFTSTLAPNSLVIFGWYGNDTTEATQVFANYLVSGVDSSVFNNATLVWINDQQTSVSGQPTVQAIQ